MALLILGTLENISDSYKLVPRATPVGRIWGFKTSDMRKETKPSLLCLTLDEYLNCK